MPRKIHFLTFSKNYFILYNFSYTFQKIHICWLLVNIRCPHDALSNLVWIWIFEGSNFSSFKIPDFYSWLLSNRSSRVFKLWSSELVHLTSTVRELSDEISLARTQALSARQNPYFDNMLQFSNSQCQKLEHFIKIKILARAERLGARQNYLIR